MTVRSGQRPLREQKPLHGGRQPLLPRRSGKIKDIYGFLVDICVK